MRHLLTMLLLCWPTMLPAANQAPLSVRIDEGNADEITFNVPFDVILTNTSDDPIRVWNPKSKNGYDQISFVFMDRKTMEVFRVRKRKKENPDNRQDKREEETLEIAPHRELKVSVSFQDEWGGLPDPNLDTRFRVWAVLQSDLPAPEGEITVWKGTVESPPVQTPFKATRLETVEDYLEYGFADSAIKLIKARGKDQLEQKDEYGHTELQRAAFNFAWETQQWKQQAWKKVVDAYLEMGVQYDIDSAIYLNDLDRVKAILKESPKQANGELWERTSPLRIAASLGHVAICRYFIEKFDVDVNDWEAGHGYPDDSNAEMTLFEMAKKRAEDAKYDPKKQETAEQIIELLEQAAKSK